MSKASWVPEEGSGPGRVIIGHKGKASRKQGVLVQLDVLREYIALCKHLNFSHAAQELHITQPVLSKHIAALEDELRFKLAERGRMLRLTPAGERFLLCAQSTVTAFDEGVAACRACLETDRPARLLWFDRPLYAGFLEGASDIPYTIVDSDGNESFFSLLDAGRVDVVACEDYSNVPALAERARQGGYRLLHVGTERLSIAVARTSLLASKDRLERADLYHCKVLVNASIASEQWRLSLAAFLGEDLNLRFLMNPTAYEGANQRRMELGDAVYVYASESVHRYLGNRQDVVVFDELDGRPIEMGVGITCRIDEPNANARAVAERLEEWVRGGGVPMVLSSPPSA